MAKAKSVRRFKMSGLSQRGELPLQVTAVVLGQLIRKQHTGSKGESTHRASSVWWITQKRVGESKSTKRKVWVQWSSSSRKKKNSKERCKKLFLSRKVQLAPNPCLAVIWATTRGCGFSKDRRYREGWGNDCLNTAKELTVPEGPACTKLHHKPKLQQSPQICQKENLLLETSETGIHEATVITDENPWTYHIS